MKRIKLGVMAAAVMVAGGAWMAGTGVSHAEEPDPFLCPAVGDGVFNATAHNNENGVQAFPIASGASIRPGQNQAGANANSNAVNPLGPGDSAGPGGGNSDWSPIWPDDPATP